MVFKQIRQMLARSRDSHCEMPSFLGFVNYHREHIAKYASVAGPLYGLTGQKAVFAWDDEHQDLPFCGCAV